MFDTTFFIFSFPFSSLSPQPFFLSHILLLIFIIYSSIRNVFFSNSKCSFDLKGDCHWEMSSSETFIAFAGQMTLRSLVITEFSLSFRPCLEMWANRVSSILSTFITTAARGSSSVLNRSKDPAFLYTAFSSATEKSGRSLCANRDNSIGIMTAFLSPDVNPVRATAYPRIIKRV